MILKVNYEKLNEMGIFIGTKREEITTTLEEILKLINEVPGAWKGIDSETFVSKSSQYVKSQIINAQKVENLSELLNIFSNGYKDKDEQWKEEMKKETIKDDRY